MGGGLGIWMHSFYMCSVENVVPVVSTVFACCQLMDLFSQNFSVAYDQ